MENGPGGSGGPLCTIQASSKPRADALLAPVLTCSFFLPHPHSQISHIHVLLKQMGVEWGDLFDLPG